MTERMFCDCCKKEAENLFMIQLISRGMKWICYECYKRVIE